MLKILITGSGGFIGKNLLEALSKSYDVYAPKKDEIDLLDTIITEDYLKNNRFDVIIHSANTNSTRNANINNFEILNNNLRMFFNLERCRKYYGKLYYFGSGAEYDMNNYKPTMKEEYFGNHIPLDSYGLSKYVMSKMAEQDNNIYNLRLFGVFGKYEEWERRFISNAICKCIHDLPITINQNVYFDYIYIDDLINIMKWFIENQPRWKHYNICTGIRVDLVTIAKRILQIRGKDLDIIIGREGLKPEYTGNNKRLMNELGEIKFIDLDVAISNLYKYYLLNKQDIDVNKLL